MGAHPSTSHNAALRGGIRRDDVLDAITRMKRLDRMDVAHYRHQAVMRRLQVHHIALTTFRFDACQMREIVQHYNAIVDYANQYHIVPGSWAPFDADGTQEDLVLSVQRAVASLDAVGASSV